MDMQKLIATGLTEQQASAYALLLETGGITPSDAAKQLDLSRTNAYKVLDKLVEIELAQKKDIAKKITYLPANPQALSNFVAEHRNIAAQREEAVRQVISELQAKYRTHNDQPDVQVVTGKTAVANAYRAQINQKQPIYFVRSRMDITSMGFDTMHEIRVMPARLGSKRYGILPDLASGTTHNTASDERTNFTRTWARQEDYDAPVEWSVSGTSLLIVLFGEEPHAITIDNPIIADAFRQIWSLLNNCLQTMPYYKDLPR